MKHLNTPLVFNSRKKEGDHPRTVAAAFGAGIFKVLLLSLCLFLVSALEAEASHFRYGNISWKVVNGTTVEYKVSLAFRSAYFGDPAVGTTLTPDLTFYHGDGTSRDIEITVTSKSPAEGWFYGEGSFTKTYSDPNGTYTAYFESCCRIGDLQNNANQDYRVETVVNLGTGNTSPVSTLPPIINLSEGSASATFSIPGSDPDGDALSFSLTPSAQMGNGSSNPSGFSVDASTGVATFNTVGTTIGDFYNASVTISDNNGARIAVDFLIKIATSSNPPVFVAPTPANGTTFTIDVGQALNFDVKAEDPDVDDVVTLQVVGIPPTASMTPALPVTGAAGEAVESSFSWTPAAASVGTHVVNFTAEDNNGAQSTSSVTIVVDDAAACNISLAATATDVSCPGGSDGTITLEATGGTAPLEYSIDNGATFQAGNEFTGLSAGTYQAVVKDANECTASTTVEIEEQPNDVPVITSLTGPANPLNVSAATVNMSAEVTDDNLSSATWSWGDGSSSAGTISGSLVSGSHTYLSAGLYQVVLTVTDACGATDSEAFEYVVVYDPDAGFATGRGWIYSPAGAYVADPSAEGRANFRFLGKYRSGDTEPDGGADFEFQSGNLHFEGTQFNWLVIADHMAHYQGEGTINGAGDYAFMLSVVDGDKKSPNSPDRLRMKIWELASGALVYDNQMGDADHVEATTDIGGGEILIHKVHQSRMTRGRMAAGEVETAEQIAGFKAYPTPLAKEGLWLEFPAMEEARNLRATIVDLSGRTLAKQRFDVQEQGGKQFWPINHAKWKSGMYVLIIEGNEGSQQLRIMK